MTPEELMIGNWVLWKNKPVQVAQISGIKYSFGHIDVVLAHCGSGFLESHDIKSISPIDITSEILLMNGFTKVEGIEDEYELRMDNNNVGVFIIIFDDGDIVVDIEKEIQDGANRIHHCEIKYIHQLQNAMRMCNIDKEIKIEHHDNK